MYCRLDSTDEISFLDAAKFLILSYSISANKMTRLCLEKYRKEREKKRSSSFERNYNSRESSYFQSALLRTISSVEEFYNQKNHDKQNAEKIETEVIL